VRETPRPTALILQSEAAATTKEGEALWVAGPDDDDVIVRESEAAGLRAIIASLSRERDAWKTRADEQEQTIGELDRRFSKDIANSNLPADVVQRLNRFESEFARLRTENSQLKEDLKAIEYESVDMGNQNDKKTGKLKGANKKVKNSKEVAGKEEEKAKDAVGDKQRHLTSERKMKKERNVALSQLQEQKKTSADLRAELEVKQSGALHTRDAASDPNHTIAVVPIEPEIRRVDVQSISMSPEANRMQLAANFETWYKEWKKPKEVVKKVLGANYEDYEKKKNARIYGDMIEMLDGYMETGAEHAGWRSKRAVEAVCRHAEARHNGES
jgi:chromosome segregation ATPase